MTGDTAANGHEKQIHSTQSIHDEDQLYRNTKKYSVSIGQQEPAKKPSELDGDTQIFLEEAVGQGEHGGGEKS